MANTDKLNLFRQELDRLGIPLLGPDINRSKADFGVEAREDGTLCVRYALAAIRNVGHAAMTGMVRAREAEGRFRSVSDLATRLDSGHVNKRQIEMLACAGAFDSLTPNRHQVFKAADTIVRHATAAAQERASEQNSLFGGPGGGDGEASRMRLPNVEDWPAMERLRYEFDAIGFYLSAHPLDSYGKSLERLRVVAVSDIPKLQKVEPGRKKVAGIVVAKQERRAKTSGNKFAFVSLSDQSGVFEVVVFSEVLSQNRDLLVAGQPLVLTVDARIDEDDIRLSAVEVEDLDQAVAHAAAGLRLYMRDEKPLSHLKTILAKESKGRGTISVVLDLDHGEEVEMALPGGYRLTPAARQALKSLPGVVVQDV
jgi:DNA polymerase-3 subunit alpha